LLAGASDPQRVYVEEILPTKLRYYLDYVATRTFSGDIDIILKTLFKVFLR
jgi:lipopolysaccharide/colanic/teichoic acid biosynthesis glycosyltransferase